MSDNREQRNQVFGEVATGVPGIKTMTAAERMKQDFGITIPADLVSLPSKGILYPQETGLSNRKQLEIKAMTTREEDILTSKAFIKKGTVVAELIKSCIVDKSVDVDALISGDRNALMIAIRCTGYGTIYKPEMECAACNQKQTAEFDLGKLAVKELTASPIQEGVNEFAFKLPVSGVTVTFKMLTGKDEEELVHTQERKKKVLSMQMDTLISDQLKASLISVKDIRDRAKLSFFVDNMPGRDSLALRDYMRTVQPGVDMTHLFVCQFCDHAEEVQIPIGIEFFWPSAK